MAVDGARALRAAADARGLTEAIFIVPNRTDSGRNDWQPSLRKFAQETPGFEITDLRTVYARPELYFFSLEFDRLIKTDLTNSQNLFNMHFSLLPEYKGMSTSVWPLIHGRTESGVTLHRILRGIDTGPIIGSQRFDIEPDDTARDLYLKYIAHGTDLFETMVGRLLDGDYETKPQSAIGSSYYGKSDIDYSAPLTDLHKTAFELRNRIRAFTFPEYQLVIIDGLQVHTSEISNDQSASAPGTILLREYGVRRIATIDFDLMLRGAELQ